MNNRTIPMPQLEAALPAGSTVFELLANTLDARHTGFCLCDPLDRVIGWNRTFVEVFHEIGSVLTPGVLYRECLRAFFQVNLSTQELPFIERHIDAARQRRSHDSGPYLYRRKDGSWIRLEWQRSGDGHLISLVDDVTDEVMLARQDNRNERRPLQSLPELKDVFANIDVAFALFDDKGYFISANRSYFDLFPDCAKLNHPRAGYADHLHQHGTTLSDESARLRLDALSRRAIDTITDNREVLVLHDRDGRWLALEERRTASGGLLSLWHDVSERVQAQHQVSTLQERLTDAIESLADAFALFDSDDRLVICNSRYRETAGFEPADLAPGVRWYDLVEKCVMRGQYPAAVGRERQWIEERRARRLQGDQTQEIYFSNGHWLQATDRRTRDGGTVSIGTDITALKNREQQLSRQAAMLSAISAAAAQLIGRGEWRAMISEMLARLGKAAAVSRVMVFRVHPMTDGRLAQSCRFEWLAPTVPSVRDRLNNQNESLQALDAGRERWLSCHQRGETIQARISELDGYLREKFSEEDVLSIISVPITVDGEWWGHISFQDCIKERVWTSVEVDVLKTAALLMAELIERNRVDMQLHDSEQRFRSIAEALPIIITHYETSEILYASPPIGDMLGITTDELPGKPVTGIYADPQQRSQILEKLKEQSTLDDEELTYRRADGSLLPATITSRRVIYAGDSAIISAITDLTERKAAEAELARQRDALHQADKMSALGSLLAGVAHELNNPLAVLVGQALMMEEQAQTQTQTILSERAAKIRNAAERCARIVKTFLSMARQRPAERSEVHLEQVIKAVLDLIDYSIRANDIGVQREIDAMLPSLWGDQDQFSQLILNLVINAQQALLAIESRRLLRISARPDRSAPGFVVLEVADNGPGVAPANRQRIFEPFFTTKPTGMGTGIGLSLCHSIVIAHGGTIECRESPEGGALFRVSLPVGQTGVEKKAEPARPRATVTSNHPILIVDDEPEIAEMLAEILQSGGYRTAIAHSGREALQRLEEQTFDLIVSDIRMPDLDGPGLYRALSGVHSGMRQRIIFVTGDILQSADTIALQKQVPIIEKPFDPDEIERIVGQQLMQLEVL